MADIELITMDEAKQHLRVDFNDDDPNIDLKRKAASAIVLNYIETPPATWLGPESTPFNIKAAALLILESLFDESEKAKMIAGIAADDLNNPAVGLMYSYRMLSMG
jgi:hypothetical protein